MTKFAVRFDKAGMMPVVWSAETLEEASAIIAMAGNQSRIANGYTVTIDERRG